MLLATAAAATISSLLTAAVLERGRPIAEPQGMEVAPAALATTAPSPGTGVPEASSVFIDHDFRIEESVPTF
jgi:hypothetical protein